MSTPFPRVSRRPVLARSRRLRSGRRPEMAGVALITGASAGLGVEFARQLSSKGHRLVLAARRRDRLDALITELGNARAIEINLSQPGATAVLMTDRREAG